MEFLLYFAGLFFSSLFFWYLLSVIEPNKSTRSSEEIKENEEQRAEIERKGLEEQVKTNELDRKSIKLLCNPLDWYKYTRIIAKMNKEFTTTCNFYLHNQYRTEDMLRSIAFTIAFEEARQERLSPEKLSTILQVLIDSFSITYYIKPFGNNAADWESIENTYIKYIDFRAMDYKPLVSLTLAGIYCEGEILSQTKILEINKELSNNRILSLESNLI